MIENLLSHAGVLKNGIAIEICEYLSERSPQSITRDKGRKAISKPATSILATF